MPREPQVRHAHGQLWQGKGTPLGIREILRVDLHMLAVAEQLAVNLHRAVRVRQQIVDRGRGLREEVEVRLRRSASRASWFFLSGFLKCAAQHVALAATSLARTFARVRCEFLHVGRALVPRTQQQSRSSEHVAGEKFLVTALEDVAVFVADGAACGVEIRHPRRCARCAAEAREAPEVAEDSAPRLEARGREMHAGERRDVCELHGDHLRRRRDIRDVQRGDALRLQIAARAEEPAVRELSAAHGNRDVALLAAQPQRVVARRESRDDEETVFDFQLRGFVRGESARALPQQRYFAGDPVRVRCLLR